MDIAAICDNIRQFNFPVASNPKKLTFRQLQKMIVNKKVRKAFRDLLDTHQIENDVKESIILFAFLIKWCLKDYTRDSPADEKKELYQRACTMISALQDTLNHKKFNDRFRREVIRYHEYFNGWKTRDLNRLKTTIIDHIYETHLSYMVTKSGAMNGTYKDGLLAHFEKEQQKYISELKMYKGTDEELRLCEDLLEKQQHDLIDVNKIIDGVSSKQYWENMKKELREMPPNWGAVKRELILLQKRLCNIVMGKESSCDPNSIEDIEKELTQFEEWYNKLDKLDKQADKDKIISQIMDKLDLKFQFQMMDHNAFQLQELVNLINMITGCFLLLQSKDQDMELDLWRKNVVKRINHASFDWAEEVPSMLNELMIRLDQLEDTVAHYRDQVNQPAQ